MGLGDTMPRIGALVRGTMNRFIPNRTRVLELRYISVFPEVSNFSSKLLFREDRVLPPPYDDQPDIQEYRSVPEDTPGPSKLQTGTSLVVINVFILEILYVTDHYVAEVTSTTTTLFSEHVISPLF
jgi:hypothetical protein